ncbi:MAG: hydrolase 1, exosortase A system-associated [Nitrosomonas sp.]|nr:hydrolase 1, exosortase A system-associated [Nitrosomonas sp.]
MIIEEIPVCFRIKKDNAYGIIHLPATYSKRGILIVVGGPQYRVGSHRQFVLLGRYLARKGIPVMRFDYRGMGDSDGETHTFESIEDDIRAAIDEFFDQVTGLNDIAIWGLCDAASAASFYAHTDNRISGLVLLNPWVRTDSGMAKTYIKHYYFSRLFERNFWVKVIQGKFDVIKSIKSLASMIITIFGFSNSKKNKNKSFQPDAESSPLPERMYAGLNAYKGPLLFILSGDDITANEFRDAVKNSRAWQALMNEPRVMTYELADANHTYSKRAWRDQVAEWTLEWLQSGR